MQQGNFVDVLLALHVCTVLMVPYGTIRTIHTTYAAVLKTTPIQKLCAENHTLQLNI